MAIQDDLRARTVSRMIAAKSDEERIAIAEELIAIIEKQSGQLKKVNEEYTEAVWGSGSRW